MEYDYNHRLTAQQIDGLTVREDGIIGREFGNWLENGGQYIVEGCMILGYGIGTNAINGVYSSGAQSSATNPLKNITYTDKVVKQMGANDYHGFPESVDAFGSSGNTFTKIGGDGISRTWVEIPGEYMGKPGVFQYIIEANGVCNHRLFVPGGN